MKNKINLQEFAEFLRDVAYADNLEHGIDWSLRIVHPKTDWGAVGFSGGIWHKPLDWIPAELRKEIRNRRKGRPRITISFSFDETKGIYNFIVYEESNDGKLDSKETLFNGSPTLEEFKKTVIEKFGIKKLYRDKGNDVK